MSTIREPRPMKPQPEKPLSLLDASGCLCAGGDCEGCNALADAFEAMREALLDVKQWAECYRTYTFDSRKLDRSLKAADSALRLADKVMTRDR